MKFFNKKGLTFVELIVSVGISVIIFMIMFYFVSDSLNNVILSNKKAKILADYYDIYDLILDNSNKYKYAKKIIDNPKGAGSDIIILKNFDNSEGIIFGIINKDDMKFETGSLYKTYANKVFGYKKLNLSEISKIENNPSSVFNLYLDNGTIFDNPIKEFQSNIFNSGTIFSFKFDLLVGYNKIFKGKLRTDVDKNAYDIFKVNFTF